MLAKPARQSKRQHLCHASNAEYTIGGFISVTCSAALADRQALEIREMKIYKSQRQNEARYFNYLSRDGANRQIHKSL